MTDVVTIDTNLLLLLIVGSASHEFIARHKRLTGYTSDDFEILGMLMSQFSEIVLLPHVLTEVSHFAGQIDRPARARVLDKLRELITTTVELSIPSVNGAHREEFFRLGLTDAMILHLCSMRLNGMSPTLITADSELANQANGLGYSVIDYKLEYQS